MVVVQMAVVARIGRIRDGGLAARRPPGLCKGVRLLGLPNSFDDGHLGCVVPLDVGLASLRAPFLGRLYKNTKRKTLHFFGGGTPEKDAPVSLKLFMVAMEGKPKMSVDF